MRKLIVIALLVSASVLLVRNLHTILLGLPDDADQGPVYRIMFFHIPSWFTGGSAIFASVAASIAYLLTKNLKWDALAVASTEIAVMFFSIGLATGIIWGKMSWGHWWIWDARMTSALVLWLLYSGCLVLRGAIEEPSQRARLSAVWSIFAFVDVPIVWYSIEWFRTQHPQPVLRGDGQIEGPMKAAIYGNFFPLLLLATAFILLRLRQEEVKREIDGLRRVVIASGA